MISASPNPFSGTVALRSNRGGEAMIQVKDVLGRQIYSATSQLVLGEPLMLQLPVDSYETYILTVRYLDGEQTAIKLMSHE